MTLRLMKFITLLVHVDFTESGGKPNLRKYPVNDEERKREQELELKEENARLRHQIETKDLKIIKLEQKVKAIEDESAGWANTVHIYEEIAERDDKMFGHFLGRETLGDLERIYREGIEDKEWNFRIQMLAEELTKQRNVAQQEKEKNKELIQINENLVKQLAEKQQDQEVSTSESPIHKQSKPIEKWREDQDLEMNKMKGELQAIENERNKWKDEAKRLQKILEWREGAIETLKGKNKSLLWKYFECTSRAAIEREAMETRIHLWIEELLQQRILGGKQVIETNNWKEAMKKQLVREITSRCEVEKEQLETRIQIMAEQLSGQILQNKLMEIKLKSHAQVKDALRLSNDILRRQLAETKQNICLPDSPTHDQVAGTCMNYATATWIRKTLTEQFLRDLPRHHEIVEALPKFQKTWQDQHESRIKEAERWNLKVEQLDLSKEGVFDRVHKLLKDRHPLYVSLPPREWGLINDHIIKSSTEYLGAQDWDANTYVGGSHGMVLMEYIPPQHGKPGLYKIKNSHGEQGGSFGQKGYILIEDKVFRAMNVRHALVARKIEWKEEAMRLKTQIHKLTRQLSFYRPLVQQKLEMSIVMGSMKMEAKRNIENLTKQLAEAKQSISLPGNPVQKQCDATSMKVAMSIWAESNKSFWKGVKHGSLRMRTTAFPKKGDFDRAHKLLKLGYPLLLRFKRGEWDVIQKYIDESSREYLGADDWKIMQYQKEGDALVVTEYIEPKDGKPGLYKIKTSHGEHAGEPGQKEYILIEEKTFMDFDLASVSVEMPYMEFRDMERRGGGWNHL